MSLKMLKRAGLSADAPARPDRRTPVFAGDRHLTAEMLYAEAAWQPLSAIVVTIYNALRDFATHGLLREIALYGSTVWYDTKTGSHFQLLMRIPGSTFMDVPDDAILSLDIPAPAGDAGRRRRYRGPCRTGSTERRTASAHPPFRRRSDLCRPARR